jgi:hypothetical protein
MWGYEGDTTLKGEEGWRLSGRKMDGLYGEM